jgi:hypothetical protein
VGVAANARAKVTLEALLLLLQAAVLQPQRLPQRMRVPRRTRSALELQMPREPLAPRHRKL